jgi:hypothetical protein
MALLPADRRATVVLFIALLFIIVGTSLIYHATYDDGFQPASHGTSSALRYEATYFYFLWASSFVTTSFQRPILMAITAGLLCSIIVFNFSLNELDLVRIQLNLLKDKRDSVPSDAPFENPFEKPYKILQQLAGVRSPRVFFLHIFFSAFCCLHSFPLVSAATRSSPLLGFHSRETLPLSLSVGEHSLTLW